MSTIQITLPAEFWDGVQPGTEALVEKWLVDEGAAVAQGDVLATLVLVKTSYELQAPQSGVIETILVSAENTVAPGQAVAILRR